MSVRQERGHWGVVVGVWLAAVAALGCATMPKEVQLRRAALRQQELAALPPGAPAVYREVLEFLWEQADAAYDPSVPEDATYACPANFGLLTRSCTFKALENDGRASARWRELADRVRAMPYTGRFADDLLLAKVTYQLFAARNSTLPFSTFSGVESALLDRFSMADAPREVLRERLQPRDYQDPKREALITRSGTLNFASGCGPELAALRKATASFPADGDFATLARTLLDPADPGPFPRLAKLEIVQTERYSGGCELRGLVFGELTRVMRRELARGPGAPAQAPAQVATALAPLEARVAAEPDPLLKETYQWLVALARGNALFNPAWLGADQVSQLTALQLHAGATWSLLARERAAARWEALASRALERRWSGDAEADAPLYLALQLLVRGQPPSLAEKRGAPLFARLREPGAPTTWEQNFGRLLAARLASTPSEALSLLAPRFDLPSGARPKQWAPVSIEQQLVEATLRRLTSEAPRAAQGSATLAVLAWLQSVVAPRLSLEGPHAESLGTCLENAGIRRVPAAPGVMAVTLSFEPPSARVVDKKAETVTETYTLPEAERRMLERALKNELAELERVEDYAAYARGRATRMKLADDKLRYGRETARDRNFDASYAAVNAAAGDANDWVAAERERIKRELEELGQPRQRQVTVPAGKQTVYDARGVFRCEWPGGSDTLGLQRPHKDEASAVAGQRELACANARNLTSALRKHRDTLLTGASVTTPSDRLAEAFIKSRQVADFERFLASLSFAAR